MSLVSATSRPYRGEHDFTALQTFLAHTRIAVDQIHYLHTGDLTWQLFHMLADFDRSQIVHLWHDAQGSLIGFVLIYPPFGSFDLQIHPAWRGAALEADMLIWAERQLQALALREHPRFATLVNQQDTRFTALLENRGYVRGGEWLYMQRSLGSPILPNPPPQGFTVRNVNGLDEAEARATVLGHAFEAPPFVERYRKLMQAPGYDRDLDLVAVDADGRFGAFAICWVDDLNKQGQFEPVGTAPAFRRLGLARAILYEGLHRMQARGAENAFVIVEREELAARRLYESVGFAPTWSLHWFSKE
jgi:ribosomal protein S18 acetylase RimI-like enzyme